MLEPPLHIFGLRLKIFQATPPPLKWYGDWYSGFLLLTFFFIYVICAYFNYLDRRAFVAKYGLTEGRLLSYIYIIVVLPFVYGQMGAQKDNGAEV